MTQLFECIDGPYRGFIVSVAENQRRIEVRDLAGRMQPEWYEVDAAGSGAAHLLWRGKTADGDANRNESLGAASY
jgi:hypothetical protein